jgi:hypothetical protein
MKKASASKNLTDGDDNMKPEYALDYQKAKSNRFIGQTAENRLVVLLDPDISEIFATPDSVNKVLRALVNNMPVKSFNSSKLHKNSVTGSNR